MKLYQLHETWTGISHPITKQPLFGGSIKVKLAGTSTLASLYSDRTGTAASNPYNLTGFLAQGQVFASGVFDIEIWDGPSGTGNKLDTWEGIKCFSPEINLLNKSGTYTITVDDDYILANATSAGFTLYLPPAANATRPITIYNVSSNTNVITIDADGSETIDGNSTLRMNNPGGFVALVSSGTQWHSTLFNASTYMWGNIVSLSAETSYTAVAGDTVIWSSAAAKTLYLPASPALGDTVTVINPSNGWSFTALTVDRNGKKIRNTTANLSLSLNYSIYKFVYVSATTGWNYVADWDFNMYGPVSQISANVAVTLTAGGSVTWAHSMDNMPGSMTFVSIQAQNTGAGVDATYAVGDTVYLYATAQDTAGAGSQGIVALIDATNITLYVGTNGLRFITKGGGVCVTPTLANWTFTVSILRVSGRAAPDYSIYSDI